MAPLEEAISRQLFADTEVKVFTILDGASVRGLLQRLYDHQPEHCCLYRGELEPDLAETAPYLVNLEAGSDFTEWVLGSGWGKHWGIFLTAESDVSSLRRHFRKFLMVHDETGKPLYFRYYDPRVLRVYLPTCNEQELTLLFGPVRRYFTEAEDGSLIEFAFNKSKLSQRSVELTKPATP